MNARKVKENVLLVLIQPPTPLNLQFFFSLDAMYLQDNFVPSYFRPLLGTVSFLDSNGFQTFCTWKYCIGHWGVGHIYQAESMTMCSHLGSKRHCNSEFALFVKEIDN